MTGDQAFYIGRQWKRGVIIRMAFGSWIWLVTAPTIIGGPIPSGSGLVLDVAILPVDSF